jgi:hypothetical protein
MASPDVTISFTLTDVSGNPIQGTVVATLVNWSGNVPAVSGTSVMCPTQVTAEANSSGVGTLTLFGNDQLSPNNTLYQIQTFDQYGKPASVGIYSLSSGSYNLSSLLPVGTIVPPFYPVANPVNTASAGQFLMALNATQSEWTSPSALGVIVATPSSDQTITAYDLIIENGYIAANYYLSNSANPAQTGHIRLASTNSIRWRNNANTADIALALDASNNLNCTGFAAVNALSYLVSGTAMSASNLSNGVTGTGSIVLSASPTLTGTLTCATLVATTISGGALSGTFTGAPTLSGNLSFTGTPTFSTLTLPTVSGAPTNTTAATLGAGASGASNPAIGDGTNARTLPMVLYKGMSFAATGNVTSYTTVLSTPTYSTGSLTLVANQQVIGSLLHIKAGGTITVSTASQNIFFQAKINGTSMWAGEASSASTTSTYWEFEAWGYLSATGAAGTAALRSWGIGKIYSPTGVIPLTGGFANTTTVINTTGTQALDLQMEFGTSETSNTCTCLYYEATLE